MALERRRFADWRSCRTAFADAPPRVDLPSSPTAPLTWKRSERPTAVLYVSRDFARTVLLLHRFCGPSSDKQRSADCEVDGKGTPWQTAPPPLLTCCQLRGPFVLDLKLQMIWAVMMWETDFCRSAFENLIFEVQQGSENFPTHMKAGVCLTRAIISPYT
ncbi:unnamed protein product [Caenorhabditis auriculariae]|uniref:Uncharacterized protein n=1 Tax=Caenorhabditis auriculariae TaxID=2777116 RepID=A0A8S1GQQ6_9PELO|nr:unnamed protein product [Caenorhabditis auriculariae]